MSAIAQNKLQAALQQMEADYATPTKASTRAVVYALVVIAGKLDTIIRLLENR